MIIRWSGPYATTSKHRMIASHNGIHQCLECGRWTLGAIENLDLVECKELEVQSLADLEVGK